MTRSARRVATLAGPAIGALVLLLAHPSPVLRSDASPPRADEPPPRADEPPPRADEPPPQADEPPPEHAAPPADARSGTPADADESLAIRIDRIDARLERIERLLHRIARREPYLALPPDARPTPTAPRVAWPAGPRPPLPPRMREKLDRARIEARFRDVELRDAIRALREGTKLDFVLHSSLAPLEDDLSGPCETVTVELASATLRQVLQAISDASGRDSPGGQICFVFRDYGIVVAPRAVAELLAGAVIPAELPYRGE